MASKVMKEIIMQGYLEKKSPKSVLGVHAWQKRYFELVLLTSAERGHEITMYYFKSDSDSDHKEPLGEIVLNEIIAVEIPKDNPGRFDVRVPSRVFALKCSNPTELKKWTTALQSLSQMNDFQKPTSIPDSPAATMQMLAQDSLNNPTKKNETRFADAAEAIDLISRGSAFIKYNYEHVTEQTTREIVTVFYRKDTTPLGSLYYCEPGEMKENINSALALHTLTDMYLGKQSRAFRSNIAAHAARDKCFTAVGTNRNGVGCEFNLEGDSKEQVAAFLFAINAILTHKGGRKVMTAEDSEREEKRKKDEAAAKLKADAEAAEAAAAQKRKQAEDAEAAEVEKRKRAQSAADRAVAEKTNAANAAIEKAEQEKDAALLRAVEAEAIAAAATAAAKAAADAAAASAAEAAAAAKAAAAKDNEDTGVVRIRRKKVGEGSVSSMPTEAKADETPAAAAPSPVAEEPRPSMDRVTTMVFDGTETVQLWLASLGDIYPAEYGKLFKDHGVDLPTLAHMSAEDLSDIGVKNAFHVKRMAAGIEKLHESGKYPAPSPRAAAASVASPVVESAPVVPQAVEVPSVPAPEPAVSSPVAVENVSAPVFVPDTPLGSFLYKLGPAFVVYHDSFAENGVDMNFLTTLQDDDLEELGVSKLHRKKMLHEIKQLQQEKEEQQLSEFGQLGLGRSAEASTPHGHFLARAQAAREAAAASAQPSAPGVNRMDEILASIREAKEKRAKETGSAGSADDIDLSGGTSIAAIAARMAAQRAAREKQKQAEAAAASASASQ